MSVERTSALLLRLYPADWRRRYGDELDALIVESSAGDVPWRVRLDVAVAAVREHGQALFRSDGSEERVRAGLLAVLWGWMLVVVGGIAVAKTSEHWQTAVPLAHRHVPSGAFDAFQVAAVVGSIAVFLGAALCLPALARRIASQGLARIWRPAAFTGVLTLAFAGAATGLASWAHTLSAAQRNGHDSAYTAVFLATGLLAIACLAAWTFLASRLVRELELPSWLLRVEIWLASAAAAAMLTITAATILWWAELAGSAPHFLGSGGTPPKLLAAGLVMLAGALLAATGARQALRSLPRLDTAPRP